MGGKGSSMTAISDHFALFSLPRRFALDADRLTTAWRDVQALVHPDRFATAPAAERRVAMQWATRANDAYRTLRAPLSRAAHLCELAGTPIGADTNTQMNEAFLMRQMAWREALGDAVQGADTAHLQRLAAEVRDDREAALVRLEDLIDRQQAFGPAAAQVRELMFIEKFEEEVDGALERIGDLAAAGGAGVPD
jgi:molecular chaperone HscB